jgi:hypothetical protein
MFTLSKVLLFISYLTEAGLGVLFFLLVLIYFPARPPKPPSATAAIKRTEYMTGLSRLLWYVHNVQTVKRPVAFP